MLRLLIVSLGTHLTLQRAFRFTPLDRLNQHKRTTISVLYLQLHRQQ